MKLNFFIGFLIACFICAFVIYIDVLQRQPVRKDCSIAEISPDFTPEERQMCRTKRAENKKLSNHFIGNGLNIRNTL